MSETPRSEENEPGTNEPQSPWSRGASQGEQPPSQGEQPASGGAQPQPESQPEQGPYQGYPQQESQPYPYGGGGYGQQYGGDQTGQQNQYPGGYSGQQYPAGDQYQSPYQAGSYDPTQAPATYGGYSQPYGVPPQNHPRAVPALVLGIIGVAACPLVGIAGLVLGSRARREIDAEPGRYSGRGMATAAWILGIISCVFIVFWIVIIIISIASGGGTTQ